MAGKNEIKFELNRAGVAELLKSEAVQKAVKTEADKRKPGSGYSTDIHVGRRASSRIYAATAEAKQENLNSNTLLKALGGRG